MTGAGASHPSHGRRHGHRDADHGWPAATAALSATVPDSAVVIHSLHDDRATQERARVAGASAFVSKHRLDLPLLAAIRQAGAPR